MTKRGEPSTPIRGQTRLVRAGRDSAITGPFVNPPVVHASTVLFDSVDDMIHRRQRYTYGRRGTPTSDALEMAIASLENAAGAVLCPSGLAAGSVALLSCLSSGDELLMVDCVYGPVRHFADTVLKRMGVTVTCFDPLTPADAFAGLMSARTKAVYLEAPGSLTFEMQDVPGIAAVAKARGATVLCDNTWATPYFFRPLDAGVDLSIQAGTKYIGGHADVNIGTIAASPAAWPALKETHGSLGMAVGPDDIFLALRGLRTLGVRLERQMQSSFRILEWLAERPEVTRLLTPVLPDDPGHALWKRDMTGACGLFAIHFGGWSADQAARFIDGLALFGIGASWGGYESLAIMARPESARTAARWTRGGALVRLHIGLEEPDDLIADLEASLAAVAAG